MRFGEEGERAWQNLDIGGMKLKFFQLIFDITSQTGCTHTARRLYFQGDLYRIHKFYPNQGYFHKKM